MEDGQPRLSKTLHRLNSIVPSTPLSHPHHLSHLHSPTPSTTSIPGAPPMLVMINHKVYDTDKTPIALGLTQSDRDRVTTLLSSGDNTLTFSNQSPSAKDASNAYVKTLKGFLSVMEEP